MMHDEGDVAFVLEGDDPEDTVVYVYARCNGTTMQGERCRRSGVWREDKKDEFRCHDHQKQQEQDREVRQRRAGFRVIRGGADRV